MEVIKTAIEDLRDLEKPMMVFWNIEQYEIRRMVAWASMLNAEIDILRQLGVEFKIGVDVGNDITLDELRKDGYKAFYLAIGAQAARRLNIEGENAKYIFAAATKKTAGLSGGLLHS